MNEETAWKNLCESEFRNFQQRVESDPRTKSNLSGGFVSFKPADTGHYFSPEDRFKDLLDTFQTLLRNRYERLDALRIRNYIAYKLGLPVIPEDK